MQETLNIEILAPDRVVLRTPARAVNLPGKLGDMTILPRHAAIVAELREGTVTVTKEDATSVKFRISGGVLECSKDHLTLLCDTVEGYSK